MTTAQAQDVLAIDRASVRDYDQDGRLHVSAANISKANICPYFGREIPDFEALGLDPGKTYSLFRHPAELAKAAATSNGIQVLRKHIPVSIDDHQPWDVVGATGTDAEFVAPFLRNSLVIWVKDDIAEIKSGAKKELSCGYRYTADMTPGSYEGEAFDGIMRDLAFNHLAIVEEGRAGPDVVIGDSMPPKPKEHTDMATKPVLTRKAAVAQGALVAYLRPKMAQDAKYDLTSVLAKVTAKNFKESRPSIVAGISEAIKGKLAKDAKIDTADLEQILDVVEALSPEEAAVDEGVDPAAAVMDAEGLSDEEEAQYQALCKRRKPGAADADETDEEKKAREAKGAKDGDPPPFAKKDDDKEPKGAKDGEKDMVTPKAMDAALKKMAADTKAAMIKDLQDTRAAERACAPLIGEVTLAMDTADKIYAAALKAHNVDVAGVDPSAFPAMVKMLVEHKADAGRGSARRMATDSASVTEMSAFRKEHGLTERAIKRI